MGCVSSKLVKKEIKREILLNNGGDNVNHVVSLKSSTYGVLKLDNDLEQQQEVGVTEAKRVHRSPAREEPEPEVINAWELMEDLEEDGFIKRSPKSRVLVKGVGEKDVRSPLKFLNQIGSPLKVKKFGGKENKGRVNGLGYGNGKSEFSPKSILRVNNSKDSSCKAVLKLSYPVKSTRTAGFEGGDSGFSSRRNFSPLFDPEIVALYEKELSEEEEQIKRIISPEPEIRKSKKSKDSKSILQVFEKKCPAGGENAVVIYTTTLRGIRKTFEACNTVRSIIESYQIQMFERDISMDSGFKEELRKLTGTKEVKVPLVFVKGRLIGGIEEIVKLEEEGKLETLFDGIPRAIPGCEGCAGVRFLMCTECNGSCKVLDGEQKKVRCGECNENGLIQCPICC
ncbi:uncharacterized protein At3g28850-like [Durio zibethinus]|uniref:Uncharacterized protein At3g28850-like n=1 Tax=Durio zibethinus TaxID=66656 RepID=A0A6P5YWA9_DURZI|nr:uncharacterized protein At3g28850-like [Durio zibethinus]